MLSTRSPRNIRVHHTVQTPNTPQMEKENSPQHAKRMKKHNIEDSIVDAFCSCVIDWLDTESVKESKFHSQYLQEMQSHSTIGWRHIFLGKLSQEWLNLQPQYTNKKGHSQPT
mmetsp:Transcript_17732/g.36787  ORF Transcript_17732/g.36787 Transcript_17732/m.36787 type:complete len:113 (-) Transcript_17732:308-646(-)